MAGAGGSSETSLRMACAAIFTVYGTSPYRSINWPSLQISLSTQSSGNRGSAHTLLTNVIGSGPFCENTLRPPLYRHRLVFEVDSG